MPGTETTVNTFAKNASQEVRARLTTYKGREYADVRVFAENEEGEHVPTRKGVSVRVEDLPKLLEAVQALIAARETGRLAA